MTVGSLFSGIGGLDLGLERAGFEIRWQVEIDDYCRRVLEKHWPSVRRYGDIRELTGDELEPVDLVCGGFPCQDLSVAGKRAGLAGERSGLFFEFVRLVAALAPRWVLIENVPGLLSSNRGRDMGTVLGTLAELGYGYAYRVLDAQYFGVAQRRRRVFIVGCLGDRTAAAKVLFEPESCERDTLPRREAGKDIARALTSSTGGVSGLVVASTTGRGWWNEGFGTLRADAGGMEQSGHLVAHRSDGAHSGMAVRRLTPLECERLQGFPDGWTAIDGKRTPDSPRYRALGNAVCVNVAAWVGKRIMAVGCQTRRGG